MASARIVRMAAQAVDSSFLAFDIAGVLDECTAEFGAQVQSISFGKLSDVIRTGGSVAGDPSRILYDSAEIATFIHPFSLASLRNEDRKASLDHAVRSRQNIYFSKYANAPAIISTIRGYYARTSPASNPNLLNRLSELAQQQASDLQAAYAEDGRDGVVRETTTSFTAEGTNRSVSQRVSKFYQSSVARNLKDMPAVPPVPWEGVEPATLTWRSGYAGARITRVPAGTVPVQTTGVNYELSVNDGTSTNAQSGSHVDYEYRTPAIEAQARNLRAQISLRNQKFDLYMFEQNIPHLETIFANELASMDGDVYQLQLALLRSILISPISGIVTGIYKKPGDFVGAGEPVLRVENNRELHLVASAVRHGPIALGSPATIETTLEGAAGPVTTVKGTVVLARGLGEAGLWEVIVRVNNLDAAGNAILPLGYGFDPEFTTLTLA